MWPEPDPQHENFQPDPERIPRPRSMQLYRVSPKRGPSVHLNDAYHAYSHGLGVNALCPVNDDMRVQDRVHVDTIKSENTQSSSTAELNKGCLAQFMHGSGPPQESFRPGLTQDMSQYFVPASDATSISAELSRRTSLTTDLHTLIEDEGEAEGDVEGGDEGKFEDGGGNEDGEDYLGNNGGNEEILSQALECSSQGSIYMSEDEMMATKLATEEAQLKFNATWHGEEVRNLLNISH